jgi:alpha-L-fucosidase 2
MSNRITLKKPALEWVDGLPLANGISATMLWGSPSRTVLSLNHIDFWRDILPVIDEDYSTWMRQAQKLMIEGKVKEANALYYEKLSSISSPRDVSEFIATSGLTNSFQPLGDILIEFDDHSTVSAYNRMLDIRNGVAAVEYEINGSKISQECFVSAAFDVIVFSIKSAKPLCGRVAFERDEQVGYEWSTETDKNSFLIRGSFAEGVSSALMVSMDVAGNGTSTDSCSDGGGMTFKDATELQLVIAVDAGKNDISNLLDSCRKKMALVRSSSIEDILARHCTEHSSMFDRVKLSLGDNSTDVCPDTDDLVAKAVNGEYDNHLAEQVFQMGRYLMMSSNRAGRRPTNLQGIWNERLIPEFDCDWHLVANIQMCHFLVNPTNLDECNLALFEQMERFLDQGRMLAKKITGCDGILYAWVGGGDGMMYNYFGDYGGLWTGAAPWIAQHYWLHYEYTQDREFLTERAYPFMKEAGLFYKEWLVVNEDGYYVAGPSISLEHPASNGCWMNVHCTLDTALVRDIMRNLLEAGRILEVDNELWPVWQDLHDNVLPYPVSDSGVLREWPEPLEEIPDHGIFAYLYPVFPGSEFTKEDTPVHFAAARAALALRDTPECKNAMYGHSYPYMACLYARFGEGDNALTALHNLARAATFDNLLTTCIDWREQGLTVNFVLAEPKFFQVDAALTATAAIAEMLLQSHGECIRLLPALPSKWHTGNFKGLKARGAFEVDCTWKDGEIIDAIIKSLRGLPCQVVTNTHYKSVTVTSAGTSVDYELDASSQAIGFSTEAGRSYQLIFE